MPQTTNDSNFELLLCQRGFPQIKKQNHFFADSIRSRKLNTDIQ